MAGYSATPLAKKLGIKDGSRIFLAGAPRDYRKLVAPLPDGVVIAARMSGDVDLAHVFSTQKTQLRKTLLACLAKLKQNGMIWVSWPKKSSKVPADFINRTFERQGIRCGQCGNLQI